MKKAFLLWLAIFTLVLCFAFSAGAEETDYNGTCGENATWHFDASTETLTISGTGAMTDVDRGIWTDVSYKSKIKKVVVESGITVIGKNAFDYLDDLRSAEIADTVTRIEESAFSGCWRMTSIKLPDSVQYIGKGAFHSCSGLTKLVLPNGLTECGWDAFNSCSNLTSVTLPSSLEKLPYDMFAGCYKLKSLTIPASVKEIENDILGNDPKINMITFLGNAPVFSESAFKNVTAAVIYPANNSTWTKAKLQNYGGTITWVPDGYAPISETFGRVVKMTWKLDKGTLTITGNGYMDWTSKEHPYNPWYAYRGMIKKVVLTGKIENVYAYAFADCSELTEVVWASTITSIHQSAFSSCTSLKTITIPDAVTHMYDNVFYGCTALKSVKLSSKLKELGSATFGNCTSLKSVTVPASVKELGRWVFMNSAVESVYFQGNMPVLTGEIKSDAVFLKMNKATIYYPENNRTWTADKIKAEADLYNGNIKFVATEELNKYTQNQQFVEDSKPSGGKNPSGNTGTNNSQSNGGGGVDVVPETSETTQQTISPTESTSGVPTETITPTTQEEEPTVTTSSEDAGTSKKKNKGAWIVWLAVGVFVAADTVIGIIYLKKIKSRKE